MSGIHAVAGKAALALGKNIMPAWQERQLEMRITGREPSDATAKAVNFFYQCKGCNLFLKPKPAH